MCSVSAKYPEEAPQVREKHNTHQKEVCALTFVRLHVLVVHQLVGAHHQLQHCSCCCCISLKRWVGSRPRSAKLRCRSSELCCSGSGSTGTLAIPLAQLQSRRREEKRMGGWERRATYRTASSACRSSTYLWASPSSLGLLALICVRTRCTDRKRCGLFCCELGSE